MERKRAVLLAGDPDSYYVDPQTEEVTPGMDSYYYLLEDLYTVTGLLHKNGQLAEAYSYGAYGDVEMFSYHPHDLDRDGGVVDNDDRVMSLLAMHAGPADDPLFDVDFDGDSEIYDYALVFQSYAAQAPSAVPLRTSGVGNPYFFTGRNRHFIDDLTTAGGNDNKQLQYNRARHYDPRHGRWLQRDPAEYTDGMNLYEYVKSNPARGVDPSGSLTVPCLTFGFGGPPVFPPYHDWVPEWDPRNVVRQEQGGFDAFRIHWTKNTGVNLYFPRGSSYSQWLDRTGTVKDLKLALGDNIKLEALGNAKRQLNCNGKQVTCIRADGSAPFKESPGGYFGTDWLSIGNIHMATYSICDISKKCCIGGKNCTRQQASCHTVFVAWDNFHFNRPWKKFYWHATLQDHYPRGTRYNPSGCGG